MGSVLLNISSGIFPTAHMPERLHLVFQAALAAVGINHDGVRPFASGFWSISGLALNMTNIQKIYEEELLSQTKTTTFDQAFHNFFISYLNISMHHSVFRFQFEVVLCVMYWFISRVTKEVDASSAEAKKAAADKDAPKDTPTSNTPTSNTPTSPPSVAAAAAAAAAASKSPAPSGLGG